MAENDGGVPPILAQKHYAQPSASTPVNLLREERRQKNIAPSGSGSPDALQLIAVAADRLRSGILP